MERNLNDIYAMMSASSSINEYGDDDWASSSTSSSTKHSGAELGAKLSGTELDLHGCSHQEVIDTIENILILQYNTGNWPLTVVTGNSQKMKSIVTKHASRRGFNTKTPIDNNPGSIVVY